MFDSLVFLLNYKKETLRQLDLRKGLGPSAALRVNLLFEFFLAVFSLLKKRVAKT